MTKLYEKYTCYVCGIVNVACNAKIRIRQLCSTVGGENPTLTSWGTALSFSIMCVSCSLFSATTVVCEEPTPASGVTVVQPHNTTVSSVIVYQCQQSGFTPSVPSSVCGEDERWSPDPSQVVCATLTGMLMEIIVILQL